MARSTVSKLKPLTHQSLSVTSMSLSLSVSWNVLSNAGNERERERERSNNGEFSGQLNRLSIDGSQSRAIWRKEIAAEETKFNPKATMCQHLYSYNRRLPGMSRKTTFCWAWYCPRNYCDKRYHCHLKTVFLWPNHVSPQPRPIGWRQCESLLKECNTMAVIELNTNDCVDAHV